MVSPAEHSVEDRRSMRHQPEWSVDTTTQCGFLCWVLWSTRLSVCLSVCEHISGTAGPIGTKFCMRIPCGRGSVLLRRRCAKLCTSGFMDDVTFGRNGRDTKRWRRHSATAINYVRDGGAVWCLWMLVWWCNLPSSSLIYIVLYMQTVHRYW